MVGPRAPVLRATVDLAHAAYADGFAHIDVSGDCGSADVEPRRNQLVISITPACEDHAIHTNLVIAVGVLLRGLT